MNSFFSHRLGRAVLLGGLLCALFVSAATTRAAHIKLFVLTGQSNSLGTTDGDGADPSPGSDPADAVVRFYWHNLASATKSLGDSGGVFTMLREQQGGFYKGSATHWGPEIGFGRRLHRAGVRDFGIIKASRGGGGNSFWSKTAADHHMYDHVLKTVIAATADLAKGGHTFEIIGLLYLQGESDSPAEAAIADTRIKELADNLRRDLPHTKTMHTTIAGIAAAGATRDTVRAKHAEVAADAALFSFFITTDLRDQMPDRLHFNKPAKLAIGERFAEACLAKLNLGQRAAPDSRNQPSTKPAK